MYFREKDCSKSNSLLQRVDSRVQHIWRLQVMGFDMKNKLAKPRHPFEGLFKALIRQVSALLLISFHLVV